jgi:hypothetical protein
MALLHTFVSVRKALADARFSGGQIAGTLCLSEQNIAFLKELVTNDAAESTATIEGRTVHIEDLIEPNLTTRVAVALYPRNLVKCGYDYFEEFVQVIERHPVTAPVHEFYIHEFEFFSHSTRPQIVEHYYAVQQFIRILRSSADYWDDRPPTGCVILFHKQKLEVPIKYLRLDLRQLDGLIEFSAELESAHDRDQRLMLMKIVFAEAVMEIAQDRFRFLLENWLALKQKFVQAYNLYLANFSWEKVRTEVDKEKIEFVKKLNATVTDIQTKLVAIPAAFFLIAAQLRNVGKFDFGNLTVVIGAVVFTAMIAFMIKSQFHALVAIHGDLERVRGRLRSEGNLVDDILARFDELETLYVRQKHILWFCLIVTISVAIVSIALFCLYTRNNPFIPSSVRPQA